MNQQPGQITTQIFSLAFFAHLTQGEFKASAERR